MKKRECWIGVDPGRNGGVSFIRTEEGEVQDYYASPMPGRGGSIPLMKYIVAMNKGCVFNCCIEDVAARRSWNSNTYKVLYRTHGWVEEAAAFITQCNFLGAIPHIWKKYYNLTGDRVDKKYAIALCKEMFPLVDLQPGKKRSDHDGMAEALLIADYARKTYHEKTSKG